MLLQSEIEEILCEFNRIENKIKELEIHKCIDAEDINLRKLEAQVKEQKFRKGMNIIDKYWILKREKKQFRTWVQNLKKEIKQNQNLIQQKKKLEKQILSFEQQLKQLRNKNFPQQQTYSRSQELVALTESQIASLNRLQFETETQLLQIHTKEQISAYGKTHRQKAQNLRTKKSVLLEEIQIQNSRYQHQLNQLQVQLIKQSSHVEKVDDLLREVFLGINQQSEIISRIMQEEQINIISSEEENEQQLNKFQKKDVTISSSSTEKIPKYLMSPLPHEKQVKSIANKFKKKFQNFKKDQNILRAKRQFRVSSMYKSTDKEKKDYRSIFQRRKSTNTDIYRKKPLVQLYEKMLLKSREERSCNSIPFFASMNLGRVKQNSSFQKLKDPEIKRQNFRYHTEMNQEQTSSHILPMRKKYKGSKKYEKRIMEFRESDKD